MDNGPAGDRPIVTVYEPQDKGIPADLVGRSLDSLIGRKVTDDTFPSPLVVAYRERIEHNLTTMARYCEANGIEIAPHVKTTMASSIIERQVRYGAWGLTAATIVQVRSLFALGHRRIMMANQLVNGPAIAWARAASRSGLDLMVFVDSREGLDALTGTDSEGSIGVLVEIGGVGGRTGLRDPGDAVALAEAAVAADGVALRGVAGYEGVFFDSTMPEPHLPVREYLGQIRDAHSQLDARGLFDYDSPIVVSAGGSACFQDVVDVLGPLASENTVVVIRSGCYVTHDHGIYERVSPLRDHAVWPAFQGAIIVIAQVLSRPEPGLAILDAGRRDVSFDEDLPTPLLFQDADTTREVPSSWHITKLMDQHAYLEIEPSDTLAVGDFVHLGISHPCTTLDKWRHIPEIDDRGEVVGVISTAF